MHLTRFRGMYWMWYCYLEIYSIGIAETDDAAVWAVFCDFPEICV
jgi:hypothetical protein